MQQFRRMRSLQKFFALHSSVHNHFNNERHLNRREEFGRQRSAALSNRQQPYAA